MTSQDNQWGNFEKVEINESSNSSNSRWKPIDDSIKALKKQAFSILTPFNSEVASQIVEDLSKVRNALNNQEIANNPDYKKEDDKKSA